VASLVPAATDLIVAMGLSDRLVAVSNFEPKRELMKELPRVGDYQTTDWEQLRKLRPEIMIVQIAPDRVPEGLTQKAREAGIRLVNVKLDRLDDVFAGIAQLGRELGEPAAAADAASELKTQILQVRVRVIGKPKVPTLLTVGDSGEFLAGPGTFLDDVLNEAGGANVAAGIGNAYPTVDREKLLALKPEAVIQLLPAASEQVIEKAKRFWASLPTLPAVKNGRVYLVTDSDALLPGSGLGRLTAEFAEKLHPEHATTGPGMAQTAPSTQRQAAP
jgi:iron complex transport system substrate-binding protein